MLGAGKALRPSLLFDFYLASTGNRSLRPTENVLRLGLAVEMFHTFTLVHDDLPSMDDDPFRRGRPTLHTLEPEAYAVLMGDALQSATFQLLTSTTLPASVACSMVARFAKSVGAAGLFEGQRLDLQGKAQSFEDLRKLHGLKTGELFAKSCELGVLAGLERSTGLVELAGRWGQIFGLLFQIADDLMDQKQSRLQMGKTPGKDFRLGRKTISHFLHGDGLRAFCETEMQELIKISDEFPDPAVLRMRIEWFRGTLQLT